MNDFLALFVVAFFGLGLCLTVVFGFRVLGNKIDQSNNALAVRLKVEFEFTRLALMLENELGTLSSAYYGLIESWPKERMKQSIIEETAVYKTRRSTLINEYETRFKALDLECRDLYPNFIQDLFEVHADSYPSLGLLTPSI